jgi:hypothetical protein
MESMNLIQYTTQLMVWYWNLRQGQMESMNLIQYTAQLMVWYWNLRQGQIKRVWI